MPGSDPASLFCRLLWRELEDHSAAGPVGGDAGTVGGVIVTAVDGSAVQTALRVHNQRSVSRCHAPSVPAVKFQSVVLLAAESSLYTIPQ